MLINGKLKAILKHNRQRCQSKRIEKQMARQAHIEAERWAGNKIDMLQTARHKGRLTARQTDRRTGRQTVFGSRKFQGKCYIALFVSLMSYNMKKFQQVNLSEPEM